MFRYLLSKHVGRKYPHSRSGLTCVLRGMPGGEILLSSSPPRVDRGDRAWLSVFRLSVFDETSRELSSPSPLFVANILLSHHHS